MTNYNHIEIENKWKDKWFKDNIYKAVDFSPKPKKYILAELPYPSGKYLHVGHMMRYTVPEIYARYLRMNGYNVMFPMGWDSFGLPAETYALKQKTTPQKGIEEASSNYKQAMQNMGYSIDWDREINTCDPNYYKWTQWLFIKLYEKGLAEIKEMPVWWCKELGVLADEEVLPGKKEGERVSERGGYPVERKIYKQWVLKITKYADKLLEGLVDTDYTDSVKQGQINWINRKEGAIVIFNVEGAEIEAFTTRPDTIFGATFIAVSPEHPQIEKVIANATNKQEIYEYIKHAVAMSDMDRQTKEKTGVRVEGIFAKHPFTKKNIPVYVADYILADFGTGAIMGVPAHDERDYEFAKKYNLPVVCVVKPQDNTVQEVFEGQGLITNSGEQYEGMNSEDFKEIIIEKLTKQNLGKPHVTYKLRDQIWSRQRYWGEPMPLKYCSDGTIEIETNLPVELPELTEEMMKDRNDFPALSEFPKWYETTDSKGKPAKREVDTMPTWAGSNWYYIRYIDPKNDKEFANFDKMKYWLPVDKYFGDAGHTTAHLLYTRFWYKVLYEEGLVPTSEPFMYRMSGGILLGKDKRKMSKSRPDFVVDPKHVMDNFGADAVRTYLAFIGPYDETYPWNDEGMKATYKFICTINSLRERVTNDPADANVVRAYHKLVKNVTEMCAEMKMNTAVPQLMIFINTVKQQQTINADIWKGFIKVLAPFAPFLAEDMWQDINKYAQWNPQNSVHLQEWPKFDESLAKDEQVVIAVQINGKVRGEIEISETDSQEEVRSKALANEKVQKFLEGKEVLKIIVVPQKIVSIVVK